MNAWLNPEIFKLDATKIPSPLQLTNFFSACSSLEVEILEPAPLILITSNPLGFYIKPNLIINAL